jgi:hypothetical protein
MSDTSGGDLHPAFNPAPAPASPTPDAPISRSDHLFREGRAKQDSDEASRSGYETERATRLRRKNDTEAEAREHAAAGLPPRQATTTGEPPTSTAGEKYRIGDVELTAQEWADVVARDAAEQSRRASLPKEAEYRVELPPDLVIPNGIELKLSPDDPAYSHMRKLAVEAGLSQAQFSKAIGIYAAEKIAVAQRLQNALAAERTKMGPTGTARMTAVQTFLNAKLGVDLATALIAPLATERQVRAYEKLIEVVTGQGAADFNSGHRDPPTDGRPGKIPNYENLNFLQRRAAQDAAKQGAR